jgi:hypothetical protein
VVPFEQPRIVKNDSNSAFGVVGYSPEYKRIVVAFRGSVNTANWIMNLKTARTSYPFCPNCSVHIGFNGGYNGVKAQLDPIIGDLRSRYPSASLMVTGHSLGGALAVLAAADLHTRLGIVEHLYTLGQPRVGNDKFAQWMTDLIPNYFRIVHYADEVTHVPQSILGFKHAGWEEWYGRDMQTYTTCPSESKACSNQLSLLKMSQADHSITLYLLIRVDDSLLSKLSAYLSLRWLRFSTKDKLFNLDVPTMLEEDRQVKEAIKRQREEKEGRQAAIIESE